MDGRSNSSGIGMMLALATSFFLVFCVAVGSAGAAPTTAHVKKMWEGQYQKSSVLDIQFRGGERTTNQLNNQHYITPVGTCWDYDVVELQKCGCRNFAKASVCCRKGSTADCEIRIGNSSLVDCSRYGQPKYGRSGDTEPPECKQSRTKSECFGKTGNFSFGPGSVIGPCMSSPYFTCPNGQKTVEEFHKRKCGPTPEDCGCKVEETCSDEKNLKCYNEWKSDKNAVDCYWNPAYDNGYKSSQCYENVKKGKTAQPSLPVAETARPDQQATQTPQVPAPPQVDQLKRLFKKPF